VSRTATPRFERYVALGDSSTEGLDDPDGRGGYRGWADRLAARVAAAQGGLLYANLAVRGKHARQVREEQLAAALALRPDLATLFAGTNDAVSRRFDLDAVIADLDAMQRALVASGATVLTLTLPDPGRVLPWFRGLSRRVAVLNAAVRRLAAANGVLVADLAAWPDASDPRLWSEDRLHANSAGHERIAAALARALRLPGTDDAWLAPLPAAPPVGRARRLGADLLWAYRFLFPWLWRHARGRSSGDGRRPKRPALLPVR
jgi:lysophospholipase L1-like esterase